MSLRDNFKPDLTAVFMNIKEMGTTREFRIADGQGGYSLFTAPVIWDTEATKEMGIVKAGGVYMGDVRCHIEAKYLPRIPQAGELIYSPANVLWEVQDCTDEEYCYVISLGATRSQAGTYVAPGKFAGNN